ncbi:MAG: gas vesicle protein, partial [Actinobacteria bacterium]|nr:gas vesicle protein [Actinomycetota bacterium]
LLDRVLAGGVVVSGDVRLSIAGVDLVTISLHALIASAIATCARGGEEVRVGRRPGGS